MNSAPRLSPAERFGIILMEIVQALAAQGGWRIPRWLIAMLEDYARDIGEALSLLAANIGEASQATPGQSALPSPRTPAAIAEPVPQPRVHSGTGGRLPATLGGIPPDVATGSNPLHRRNRGHRPRRGSFVAVGLCRRKRHLHLCRPRRQSTQKIST